MRHLYIVPAGFHVNCIHYCSFWHGTELPSGEHLVSMQFSDEYSQREWESMPGVEAVGSEHDPTPVDQKHVDRLTHMGVKAHHTARDVRKMAQKRSDDPTRSHKLM